MVSVVLRSFHPIFASDNAVVTAKRSQPITSTLSLVLGLLCLACCSLCSAQDIIQISTGSYTGTAVSSRGKCYVWGWGSSPIDTGLDCVVQASAGWGHVCFVTTDGNVCCYDNFPTNDDYGANGAGTIATLASPKCVAVLSAFPYACVHAVVSWRYH